MDRYFVDTITEREATAASEATRVHDRSWDRTREHHVFEHHVLESPSFDAPTSIDATRASFDPPTQLEVSAPGESAWAAWIGREPERAPPIAAFAVTELTPLPSPFADPPPPPPRPAPLARRMLDRLPRRARVAIALGLAAITALAWVLWPAPRPVVTKAAVAKEDVLALADDHPEVEPLAVAPPLADAAALVINGRAEDAARAYAALARAHPDRPELATMARLLARPDALGTREEGAP